MMWYQSATLPNKDSDSTVSHNIANRVYDCEPTNKYDMPPVIDYGLLNQLDKTRNKQIQKERNQYLNKMQRKGIKVK